MQRETREQEAFQRTYNENKQLHRKMMQSVVQFSWTKPFYNHQTLTRGAKWSANLTKIKIRIAQILPEKKKLSTHRKEWYLRNGFTYLKAKRDTRRKM